MIYFDVNNFQCGALSAFSQRETKLPPSIVDLTHITQSLLPIVRALVGLVAVIQAAFSQIARKRLVGVSLGILGPSIESCPREPVEGHCTGFAGLRMELIGVYPANPVNSFLFVVHALNQRPDRITGKRRISPLVHIGENIGIWRPPYPWG